MASFTRAISSYAVERTIEESGPYQHVIKVDLRATPTAEEARGTGMRSIKYQLTVAAAKELGLLDQEYNELKEDHDRLQYYCYGSYGGSSRRLETHVWNIIVPRIGKHLATNRYLLIIDNLRWPVELSSFTQDCGLPPPLWTDSRWIISVISHDAYTRSKSEGDAVIRIENNDGVIFFTTFALCLSADHILSMTRQESKGYWHRIALACFHYCIAMVMFAEQSQVVAVTSHELIHQWAAQGILPHMVITEEKETSTISSKCSYMHRVGSVILEAFQKYSLLQLPFSPAYEDREAANTAAQFMAYHGLIAEPITIDGIFDYKKKWISFIGDNGCHVSREWLSPEETCGPTALILRGCSQQSPTFSKLNHLLPTLRFLRVLDLSYTPLKSLPSSIGCLQKLRLLSLRGCHELKTLSSSSTTSARESSANCSSYSPLSTLYQLEILDMKGVPFSHLTQDIANRKSNLIYLDMSYSEITCFPPSFFQDMSNLEELILATCSNLVDLSPSMASLSNLTTLEVTGTQIKYFPQKIFEEMQKLQSLKLIDNQELISLTRPISRGQGIGLEGHPNLISFMLTGAPHIRCLSLRGCRNLESVEIENLVALEELDLSGTAIVEFPAEIINSTQLRRLLLMGVPSLRRFPWHKLKRLPDVFYLDHCSEGNGNHSNLLCQVCVTDPRFFHSFSNSAMDLVRDGRFFQSFYIQVAPCITNSRQLQDEEDRLDSNLQELLQNQSTYVDVYGSYFAKENAIASAITVPLRRTELHVDITGMQETHDGLDGLLNVTKSVSVTCDTSIKYFFYLSRFLELEECVLRWCHKLESVFGFWFIRQCNLRSIHVYNMRSLVSFCKTNGATDFELLSHLHLEDCPRLEHVMPHRTTLPCLKTLDILFCYNLKTIFIADDPQDNTCQLPSLQRVRLQELPLLQHFHNYDATITAPMWKELRVRGCWSHRRLPHLQGRQLERVKVNGERSWWSKLQWSSHLHRDSYDPKLPPEFASFDERAEMSSYLR